MISTVIYILHVIIGGALWEGYSHLEQPISDLTALTAPDRLLLSAMTSVYGILALIFAIVLYCLLKQHVSKILRNGLLLLIVMEAVSFFGYMLFPLKSLGVEHFSFMNIMHIAVTAIVVVTTICSTFLLGIGFLKIQRTKRLGLCISVGAIIITISGISIGFVISNELPIVGLIERINIFSLLGIVFILSYSMHKKFRIYGNLNLS